MERALFIEEEVGLIRELFPVPPGYGFVSCFPGEEMHRLYIDGEHSPQLQGYIDYYEGNPTVRPLATMAELFCGEPGYVTLIGVKEDIKVLYERVKQYPGWESLYQKDTYREEYWLEIGDLYNLKSGTIEERVSVKAIPDDIV